MRSVALFCALLPGLAFAQSLPYERIGAAAVAVPDGITIGLGLADNGWSLIRTTAPNISSPPRFGFQYYFRSPEGTLSRIAIEPLTLQFGYSMNALLTPDGESAFLVESWGDTLFRVDRTGTVIRRYALTNQDRNLTPFAHIGNYVYLREGIAARDFTRLDLTTGEEKVFFDPSNSLYGRLVGITPDGTKAVYSEYSDYTVRNLNNGLFRTWKPQGDGRRALVLDGAARYAWVLFENSATGVRRMERHEIATGKFTTYSFEPSIQDITMVAASDRFLYFRSSASYSPKDTNGSPDIYLFDRRDSSIHLHSTQRITGQAAGRATLSQMSPSGALTMFISDAPGVTDLPANGFFQLYTHTALRNDTKAAVVAKGTGGSETADAVLSRNGTGALLTYFANGSWSVRSFINGLPTVSVSTPNEPRPLAVSDDGRTIVWSETVNNQRDVVVYCSRNGAATTLETDSRRVEWVQIEPKTGDVFTLFHRSGTTAFSYDIVRHDRTTGIATTINADSPAIEPIFDADAGRIAWQASDGVQIYDLATGGRVQIPLSGRHLSPALTADGVYVAVGDFDASGNPDKTRLFRTSDGAFRRTLPFGTLYPDGKWLFDGYRNDLVNAETGARLPVSLSASVLREGQPVGPAMLEIDHTRALRGDVNVDLGDAWQFRAVALTLPFTTRANVNVSGNKATLSAAFQKAGLENASTWTEYRVDGTGTWRRLNAGATAEITLAAGLHTVEFRAADALGRIEDTPREKRFLIE